MSRPARAFSYSICCLIVAASLASPVSSQDLNLESTLKPLNPLSELDPLSFNAFLQRPLFSASRRPPSDPPVEEIALDATSQDLDIRLLGIIVTPEGSVARIAMGQAQTRALRRGDLYQDWQVLSLDQSTLILGRNGETRVFTVFGKPITASDVRVAAKEPAGDLEKQNSDPTQKRVEVLPVTAHRTKSAQEQIATTQEATSTKQDLIDFFGPTGQPAE